MKTTGQGSRSVFFYIMLAAAIFVIFSAGRYELTTTRLSTSGASNFDWNDEWLTESGLALTFPARLPDSFHKAVRIQKKLPRVMPSDVSVVICSNYLPIEASLDEEALPVSGSYRNGPFGLTYASPCSIIPLPLFTNGGTISLTFLPYGSKAHGEVYSIQLGNNELIQAQNIQAGEMINYYSFCLMLLSAIFILVSLFFRRNPDQSISTEFHQIALLIFLSAVWFITDNRPNAILFGGYGGYLFINLFSYLLMAIPFVMMIQNACQTGKKLLNILTLSTIIFEVIVICLIFFGIFDLSITLFLSHVFYVLLIISNWSCLFIDYFLRRRKSVLTLFLGMSIVALTGLATVINFYQFESPDNASWFRSGIGIYSIMLSVMTVFQTVRKVVEISSLSKQQYAAEHDPLTGLLNRSAFSHRAENLIKNNQNREYVIGSFGIDRFSLINDLFGREQTDHLLMALGNIAHSLSKDHGCCGRIESDKFVICLPYSENVFNDTADKVQNTMDHFFQNYSLVAHFGWYMVDDPAVSGEMMIDRALLARETVMKNLLVRSGFYGSELRNGLLHEQTIVNQIDQALESGQITFFLQPKYRIADERIIGAESLVRWIKPDHQMIMPAEFIPILERNGLITIVDQYVWEHVCQLQQKWIEELGVDHVVPISLNVSRAHLFNKNLVATLTGLTIRYQVPPRLVPIEITESAYSDNPDQLIELTNALHIKGFEVHMDDFGSGYSSLNMLKDVNVDVLKLDMKFLSGKDSGSRSLVILKAIIGMASAMGVHVIAEGVEQKEQLEMLQSIGCEEVQGYYYSRPVPIPDMREKLEKLEKQREK